MEYYKNMPFSAANNSASVVPASNIQHRYEAPWNVYAMNWSIRGDPTKKFRLAVGSYLEGQTNKVQIIQLDKEAGQFKELCNFQHNYPATKIMWIPDVKGAHPDLLATSGDHLRIWRVLPDDGGIRMECVLNNSADSKELAVPLPSFDWNETDPDILATASLDNTCTIWRLETGQAVGQVNNGSSNMSAVTGKVQTRLLAHEEHVYDVAFTSAGGGRDIFASVGAEGSLRMFDLRRLVESTIIYEEPQHQPLVRLAWNNNQPNYIATFAADSTEVIVLDVRRPCSPVACLNGHKGCVNAISWAPHSSSHMATAGDDQQALIWDTHSASRPTSDPILAYQAEGPVNQISWANTQPEWISICYNKTLEILRL